MRRLLRCPVALKLDNGRGVAQHATGSVVTLSPRIVPGFMIRTATMTERAPVGRAWLLGMVASGHHDIDRCE